MHRFVPECDATHRSFRVNVLHVIYTRHHHHHQHHHPRHHNHHHRWITLHSGSDSIDSSWRSRWKSHGVNNKCFSNYTTRLTLFSICIINKSFYYNIVPTTVAAERRHCTGLATPQADVQGLSRPSAFRVRRPVSGEYPTLYMFIYIHIVWSCKYILIQQAAHFVRT